MNIDFTQEQLVAFYRSTSADGRKAVKEALGEKFSEILPATERVKTYEDAVNELGEDNPIVVAASTASWLFPEAVNKDLVAYMKMRVIVAALNDGWEPQFVPGEQRWYPWYELISKEDYEAMSEDEKQERRCVGRSSFTLRMRLAVSFTRMRITPRRTRTRSTALGSPSKAKNWQNMPESSSQNCLLISASSPSLMKKNNRA